jgi:hypothetical protein
MGWNEDTLGRWRYRHRCDACDRSLYKVPIAPMLRDDVWRQIGEHHELLCLSCARQRAKYRIGRDITVADLAPVPINFLDPWHHILPPGNLMAEIEAEWDSAIDEAAVAEQRG